jgi:hypothetical protein
MNVTRALNDTRTRIHAYAYTYTRTGARVRARETFRVGMRGVVGAFRFAFLFAHTCVRGGACAYRCARGGGVGCNGAGTFERRRVPWLLRIHRLQQQVCELPLTQTRLRFTSYAHRSRRRDAFTSHELLPKRLRLPPTQKRLRLSSVLYLLPLGVSLLVFFCLLGLVLLYPSARLENRIISWHFDHLCRS